MSTSKRININEFAVKCKYDGLKQKIKELDNRYLRNLEAYVKAKKELCKQLALLNEEATVVAYVKKNKLKLIKEI